MESPLVAVVAPAITQLPLLHPVVTIDVVPVVVHDVKPFSKPELSIALFPVTGILLGALIGAEDLLVGKAVGDVAGVLVGDFEGPVVGEFLVGVAVGDLTGAEVGDFAEGSVVGSLIGAEVGGL